MYHLKTGWKIIVVTIFFLNLMHASTATDICNENFDKSITQQQNLKNSLETLVQGISEKESSVKKAYMQVSEYGKKVHLILRNNLVKSTLKLALDTYQELSPLLGSVGEVNEIIEWVEGKAESYIKQSASVPQKDYYDAKIQAVANDFKNLTPDIKLLKQMSEASLEAFKIKIYKEREQTIGDVGALYTKLSSLVEQSEKTKRSLYHFYLKLHGLNLESKTKLSKMNTLINSYTLNKEFTCKDTDENSDIEEVQLSDYNFTKITLGPYYITSGSCDNDSALKNQINTLIVKREENIELFYSQVYEELKKFDQDDNKTLGDSLLDPYHTLVSAKDFGRNQISVVTHGYNPVLECDFFDKNAMDIVLASTYSFYKKLLDNVKQTIENLKNNTKSYDNYAKSLPQDKLVGTITKQENEINQLITNYHACFYGSFFYTTTNHVIDHALYSIKAYKKSHIKLINKLENGAPTKNNEREISVNYDVFRLAYLKDALIKLPQIELVITHCIESDEKALPLLMDYAHTMLNHHDELLMAKKNLFDYLDTLEKEKLTIKTKENYFYHYNINTSYFQPLYDKFEGNDIEFLKYAKTTLLPIANKITALYNFYTFTFEEYEESKNSILWSYVYKNSNPLVNVKGYINLKDLILTYADDRIKYNNNYVAFDFEILNFIKDFASSRLPAYNNMEPFTTIRQNLYRKAQKVDQLLGKDLNNVSNFETLESLKSFKYDIDYTRNFYYQYAFYLSNDIFIDNVNNLINDAKKAIYQQAQVTSIQASEEELFNYNNATINNYNNNNIELNISTTVVNLLANSKAVINIKINSSEERELELSALSSDNSILQLQSSWDNPIKSQNYMENNFTLEIDSLLDSNKTVNITIRVTDYVYKAYLGIPKPFVSKIVKVNIFPEEKMLLLEKGWNLLSGNLNLSSIPKNISIIWSYKDGDWSAFSPIKNINDLIKKYSITNNINQMIDIPKNSGIWIFADTDEILPIFLPSTHNSQISIKNAGWTLAGTQENIKIPQDISCSGKSIEEVWRYSSSDNKWLYYMKDSNNSTLNEIFKNEGFWVLCK